jgi:uncharacterized delta-60 repeat protein
MKARLPRAKIDMKEPRHSELYRAVLCIVPLVTALLAHATRPGDLDPSFDSKPTVNGIVYSIALLTKGQMVISGDFIGLNGAQCQGVAWLNADGSTDLRTTNSTRFNGNSVSVYTTAVQPDGKVLVSVSQQGASQNKVIDRLNLDGSVDSTFQSPSIPFGAEVHALAVQPDGKIIAGGRFTVVRLNPDGIQDTNFVAAIPPLFNGGQYVTNPVFSVLVQPDGKVLAGGFFQGFGRTNITRLNSDGSLDTTFQNGMRGPDALVTSLALQADGKILLGGLFTNVNGVLRHGIARLNSDGSVDTTFQNGMSGVSGNYGCSDYSEGGAPTELENLGVCSIVVQPDAKVLIAGNFTNVNGIARNGIARLNSNGSVDSSFLNGLSGIVGSFRGPLALKLQADGKILVGGAFTAVNGIGRNNIARLNSDGSLDMSFHNGRPEADGPTGWVRTMHLQPDGRALVAFKSFPGVLTGNAISRLNLDGSVDTSFQGAATEFGNSYKNRPWSINTGRTPGVVNSIALQPDGKVLVGGLFSDISHVVRNSIARLNTNGTLDTTFQNGMTGCISSNVIPYVSGTIYSVALQADAKVLVSCIFNYVNGSPCVNLARLNTNGSLDLTFSNVFSFAFDSHQYYPVWAIAVQPDGKILVGGDFKSVNNIPHSGYIVRLNSDGSLDSSFQHSDDIFATPVYGILLQPDGKILFGSGRLNPDGSLDSSNIPGMPFALQPDAKIFSANSRFYQDGVGDGGFAPPVLGDSVGYTGFPWGTAPTPVVQAGGNILFGGEFTTVNGELRPTLVRVYGGNAPLTLSILDISSNYVQFEINGERGQTVVVEASTNLVNWAPFSTNQFGEPSPPWVTWWSPNKFPIRDIDSANYPNRFYRARLQ